MTVRCRSMLVSVWIWMGAMLVPGASLAQTPYEDPWLRNHPLHRGPANEYVDPLTGSANIVTTDLVLPGNAGFSLPITRWYASNHVFPNLRIGSHQLESPFSIGVGWRLHFGRVVGLQSTSSGATVVELPVGGGGPLYRTTRYSEGWMTKDFALYNRGTHTLKLPNGRVYKFGYSFTSPSSGVTTRYVTEIKDPFNNRVTFEYFTRTSGEVWGVSRIVQHLSSTQTREVTFTYDPTTKRLMRMQFNGRTWTYEHLTTAGSTYVRLTKVWYPGNTTANASWTYGYGGHNNMELTKITYPNGGTVSYTYAEITRRAQGLGYPCRVVTTRKTGGNNITAGTWTFAYDQSSTLDWTFVTGPTNRVDYRFWGVGTSSDFAAWIKGALRERRVVVNGVIVERELPDYIQSERISNDSIPPVTGSLWGDGAIWNALVDRVRVLRGQTWTRTFTYRWGLNNYNDFNQPVSILEVGELTRTISRGYHGQTQSIHLPGKLSWEKLTVDGVTVTTTDFTWDLTTGFLLDSSTNGIKTTFTPLSNGNVATATDANGNQTTFQHSWGVLSRIQTPELLTTRTINENGWVTSETTGSLTTSYTYDGMGRVTLIKPPGSGTLSADTQLIYTADSWSRQLRTIRGSLASEEWVDGYGRQRLTIGPDGVRRSVTRDADGRVTFKSYPHTSTTSVPGISITHDGLGRTLTETTPDGSVTRYAYSKNDVTVTDAENRSTTYTYDAWGHPDQGVLASVQDAAGNLTTYGYSMLGALIRVSVPGVPDRVWVYNSKNCLTSDTQPESGTTTYQRDAVCNATQITDAEGQVFTLTYDGNNRLTDRNAPGSASDLSITYDSRGRVTAREIPSSRTSYTYDTAGRLASRTDTHNGITWQSEYAYDTLDRLTALTYPSGRVVGYSYDSGGRLDGVTQQGQVFADAFSYTDAGQLEAFRTGTVVQTLDYDNRLRVRRLTAGAELDLTYTYDRTSNVLGIADARPGQDQTFDYDALSRLTDATGPWGQLSWTYDAAGNRLTENSTAGSTTYTYSASTERLLSTSGATSESFSYDAIGRLTADGRGTYTYTATSKLATANTPAGQASYGYTPEDFRIASVVNGTAKYTVRGAGQQVVSEYEGGAWTRDLIYAGGRLLGSVRDRGVEFYAIDSLGSMRTVFDAAGTVIGQSDYLPFGGALSASGTLPAQRFTGQERDEEDGLDYFNARMYQPRSGRFSAIDPAHPEPMNPQGWNRYSYAVNNPVAFTDPSGMTYCGVGSYWCPGSTSGPHPIDNAFNPDAKGYQGGELAAGEAQYAANVNATFWLGYWASRPQDHFNPTVTTANSLSSTDSAAAQRRVGAAVGLINSKWSQLSPLERETIQNITAIGVSGTARRSFVNESTGELTFTLNYVMNSSTPWLASAIAHDGEHVALFQIGGAAISRGLPAEVQAMQFQLRVGATFGLSAVEIGHLNSLIRNPSQLQTYINMHP